MEEIKLFEICDKKHILTSIYNIISYQEILDDLTLELIDEYSIEDDIKQILKHSKNLYLLICSNKIISFSLENDFIIIDPNFTKVHYILDKAINLPKEKVAITTENSEILIYKIITSNIISLFTKINIGYSSPLSLYYIEKTNEILIRGFEQISFMNLNKYTFDYVIKSYNYYIWNSNYNQYLGTHSMENNYCMINDYLLAMSFSKNVITLINLNTHQIIKNFIDTHDNITSLIKPENFLDNHFLCSIYSYDCHGGQYYYFAKAKIIDFGTYNNDSYDNFDIEYNNKIKIDKFPMSIKLLRDGIILMLCLKKCGKKFELNIFKFN